jgi:hypothetical protein
MTILTLNLFKLLIFVGLYATLKGWSHERPFLWFSHFYLYRTIFVLPLCSFTYIRLVNFFLLSWQICANSNSNIYLSTNSNHNSTIIQDKSRQEMKNDHRRFSLRDILSNSLLIYVNALFYRELNNMYPTDNIYYSEYMKGCNVGHIRYTYIDVI